MKSICKFILNLIGWKVVGNTNIPEKCVICVAPHTSNWDLPLGLIIYTSLGKHASFLIKKDWFFFPMNILFKALGGVPVDRTKKTSLTEQMANIYSERSRFQLAVAPEGTRQANSEWKKGFYYIALTANVPIVLVGLNYKKKEADFMKVMIPTGNVDSDIEIIKQHYVNIEGRHAKRFSL